MAAAWAWMWGEQMPPSTDEGALGPMALTHADLLTLVTKNYFVVTMDDGHSGGGSAAVTKLLPLTPAAGTAPNR